METKKRDLGIIKIIIMHCSDSDNPEHDHINVIRTWHKKLGFYDVGYHFFIRKSGEIQQGRKIYNIGAHCKGHNMRSIGICLSGRHEFTENQFKSAQLLYLDLADILTLETEDGTPLHAHNEFNPNKTCPNFELQEMTKFTNAQLADYKQLHHPLDM